MSGVTDALWARYRATGDPDARRRLLDAYLGLVHHLARELMPPGVRDIELDDLIGAGTVGMVQALEGFDPGRGLTFSTFAVPRIRGAILDELRRRDWMPRGVRARSRLVDRTRAALEQRLGRAPEAGELAAALGVDLETFWRWREEIEPRALCALDADAAGEPEGAIALAERIPDRRAAPPTEAIEEDERRAALAASFVALPEKDRMVLTLYFFENLNLKQIGEVLHVSESRVSQLRTRALARLRHLLEQEEAA